MSHAFTLIVADCYLFVCQVAKRLEKFQRDWGGATNQKDGIINLGRGFPNFDGPEFIKEAAIQAIRDGKNQYARGFGVPELNIAIADRFKKDTGIVVDPDKEVTVTTLLRSNCCHCARIDKSR